MSLRRGVTYLLLIANWLIALGLVVVLIIFLNSKDLSGNQYNYNISLSIIGPIVCEVVSSCLLVLYSLMLKKSLNKSEHSINPKLMNLIKSTSYISIINLVLPLVFAITSITLPPTSKVTCFALIVTSIALSIIIGLFITGFTSYVNFRISFNELKRKTILEGFEPTMKMYKDDIEYKNDETKNKYESQQQEKESDELATSGTFNE